MRIVFADPERPQSKGEEIFNSLSHGLGLIAAMIGAPVLIWHAAQQESTGYIIGTIVFSITLVFLYSTSTIYHALPIGRLKYIFQLIEHSAIFLLIAGTYTPFTLGVLRGAWGWSLFGVIWGLAFAGVMLKLYFKTTRQILFTCLYVLMGWVVVIALDPLLTRMPSTGFLLLLAGGLSYTAGVYFFTTDFRLKYGHFIWHLFVIAGTGFHYFAILWYAA